MHAQIIYHRQTYFLPDSTSHRLIHSKTISASPWRLVYVRVLCPTILHKLQCRCFAVVSEPPAFISPAIWASTAVISMISRPPWISKTPPCWISFLHLSCLFFLISLAC